jgi:hypothetical protein
MNITLVARNDVNDRPYVFDTTEYHGELTRLRAIERVFDPGTRRCLLK